MAAFPDIFLSYSREDQAAARRVALGLEAQGFSVWWDVTLRSGEDYDEVTEKALRHARAVIVLWSKQSVASRWVRTEATIALQSKTLMPVMIENCQRPIMFELTHTTDLSHWKGDASDPAWQTYVGDITRFIRQEAPPDAAGSTGHRTHGPASLARWLRRSASFARARLPWLVAAVSLLVALYMTVLHYRAAPPPAPMTQLSIVLQADQALRSGPAISRDGRRIAYVASDGIGRPQLYLRALDEADSRLLPGTEEADQPFFSPDGEWIAYYAKNRLWKIRVDGGAPIGLASSPSHLGGTWTDDGTIIYKETWNGGLEEVSANGGPSSAFLTPDTASEYAIGWPYAIPGSHDLLFVSWGKTFNTVYYDAKARQRRIVSRNTWRRLAYAPPGLLVAAGDGELVATRLPGAGDAIPGAVSVLKDVDVGPGTDGAARFDLAPNGTLAYVRVENPQRWLTMVDRDGHATRLQAPAGGYQGVVVSPDGRRAVVATTGKLSILDVQRGTLIPLVPDLSSSHSQGSAVWSPDGLAVTFASNQDGNWDLYSKPANGAGPLVTVLKQPLDQFPLSYAPDGTLLFQSVGPQTGTDLWLLPPGGPARPWLATGAEESQGRFSPDGRVVAYTSNASGRSEVYLQSRDDPSDRTLVSVAGGDNPRWSGKGDRLFYRQGNLVMEAAVSTAGTLSAGVPTRILDGGWTRPGDLGFDAMPDGRRFLMVEQSPEAVASRIQVVLNWLPNVKLQ